MATLDWPTGRAFGARHFAFGVRSVKSAFAGFFSRSNQSVSHLADRLQATIVLPKCEPVEAARREAFFMEAQDAGHWLRMPHMQRLEPNGTLRGAPTVATAFAAGVRQISLQTTPGATLLGGDPIGIGGQLLLVGHAGAVANGSGVMAVPLVLPTRKAAAVAATVTWAAPTGVFQLVSDLTMFGYGRQAWQDELELMFQEA